MIKWSLALQNHNVFTIILLYDLWFVDQFQFLDIFLYWKLFHFEFQVNRNRVGYLFYDFRACHTTRPPYFGEGDRVDYHFISQEVFDEMLNMVRMFSSIFVVQAVYILCQKY
jgi:hypothetical protein